MRRENTRRKKAQKPNSAGTVIPVTLRKLCALSMLAFLYACSDGGTSSPEPTGVTITQPPPTSPVSGGAVKGPLANAVARVFRLDPSASDLKGDELGTGTTGTNAALQGLTIPNGTQGLLLIEVVADDDTIDITTGAAPIITTLRTVVDASDLSGSIYVTPLTSIGVGLAQANADSSIAPNTGDDDGTITVEEFTQALRVAGSQVVSSLGFGLDSATNIFLTRALLTNDDDTPEEQRSVLAYRQAIEAVSAVLDLTVRNASANNPNTSLTPDIALQAIAADLSDGVVDGNSRAGALMALNDVSDVANIVTTDVSTLMIPGTDRPVSDIASVIAAEQQTTGVTVSSEGLTNGDITSELRPAKTVTDADGDGVEDRLDAFPNDANETIDSDSDGIGNNTDEDDDADGALDANDAFPLNPQEQLDTDGDGIGNNTDSDDDGDGVPDAQDALPTDPTETVDTDGDLVGNNFDVDDDNDGVDDVNDAFPLDASESADTDADGIGNTLDTDDDGDGVADVDDILPLDSRSSRGTKQLITVAGGTIFSTDQRLSIEIPANALTEPTEIIVGDYDFAQLADLNEPDLDSIYVLHPDNLRFAQTANLTMQPVTTGANINRNQIPFALTQSLISTLEGSTFDREANTVSLPINELLTFGLGYGEISIEVNNAEGVVGENFEAGYTVRYFEGEPLNENEIFPEGLQADGTFLIEPTVVGEPAAIDDVFHFEPAQLPTQQFELSDSGEIFGECIAEGLQSFTFNMTYKDTFGNSQGTTQGQQKVTVTVACEPRAVAITSPIYIGVGTGIDRLTLAPPPPYNGIECTEQLYVVVSDTQTLLTTADGSCQVSRETTANENTLGAVLISDPGGDRLVTHTLTSTSICPLEEGAFCQLFQFFSQRPTTDAQYGRNADGSFNYEQVVTVSNGSVFSYEIDDAGVNQETTVRNQGAPFISFSFLDEKQGLGVTNDTPSEVILYNAETNTNDVIGEVGDGAVNIQCRAEVNTCGVSLLTSQFYVSVSAPEREDPEIPYSASDFTISEPVADISTASPGTAINRNGEILFALFNDLTGLISIAIQQTLSLLEIVFNVSISSITPTDVATNEVRDLTNATVLSGQAIPPSEKFPNGGVLVAVDAPDDAEDSLVTILLTQEEARTLGLIE